MSTEQKTDTAATTHCNSLVATLTSELYSPTNKIQWIKTMHDYRPTGGGSIPCYIAVKRDGLSYTPLIVEHGAEQYYVELHVHGGVQAATALSPDKIRIKKSGRGINLRTTRPNRVPPINNRHCNILNKDEGISGIGYTLNRALIVKVFENTAVFFNDQATYETFAEQQYAAQRHETRMTPEEIAEQDKINQRLDSFAHEYFGDVLQNELNYGYGEYSDYTKPEYTGLRLYDNVNYSSFLLVFCGGIILILLCLVCFAVALVCGFFVGKSVRKMKNSRVIPFDIENELHH